MPNKVKEKPKQQKFGPGDWVTQEHISNEDLMNLERKRALGRTIFYADYTLRYVLEEFSITL